MGDAHSERRSFHRVVFHRPVTLFCDKGQQIAQLLDISLKGALLEAEGWHPQPGNQAQAQVDLGDNDPVMIDMYIKVQHVHDDHVGVQIESLDLDSATRLRRLVELNLADPELLERELEHLLPAHS